VLAAGGDSGQRDALLAGIYTLTTRMLIKLDDQQLGWMAADRARVLASADGDPLAVGEAARNLAVLARTAQEKSPHEGIQDASSNFTARHAASLPQSASLSR
jgi:hypothetical protein